jgi:hypothetical protein
MAERLAHDRRRRIRRHDYRISLGISQRRTKSAPAPPADEQEAAPAQREPAATRRPRGRLTSAMRPPLPLYFENRGLNSNLDLFQSKGPPPRKSSDQLLCLGGTQTSYTSGNLDALVLAKINGALRSLQRDPMRIAGLNTDENAKPCADRVPIGQ